ncbi:MAG: ComF family protein [Verrucomicrobium sp.]|nr:ComF family protein [Verrucomicrobium sp.]
MWVELYSAAKEWGRTGADLLFPPAAIDPELPGTRRVAAPFCRQCGEPFPGVFPGPFLCANCQEREWSLAWARAAYRAEGTVRDAILHFKYGGQSHYLSPLTDWLEDGFRRFAAGENWDGLVPVPLHPLRRRERGFNQAAELARALGRRQGIPVLPCLKRARPTVQQARLSRGPRLRNLLGAFQVNARFDVEGRHLLLIDDVLTTGATAEACARILLAAGAARVAALTIARA